MNKLVQIVFTALMLAARVQAQEAPVGDIAAGYSHLVIIKGYTISMDGASGAVAFHVGHGFSLAADLGIYHGYPGESLDW